MHIVNVGAAGTCGAAWVAVVGANNALAELQILLEQFLRIELKVAGRVMRVSQRHDLFDEPPAVRRDAEQEAARFDVRARGQISQESRASSVATHDTPLLCFGHG